MTPSARYAGTSPEDGGGEEKQTPPPSSGEVAEGRRGS